MQPYLRKIHHALGMVCSAIMARNGHVGIAGVLHLEHLSYIRVKK